MPNQMTHRRSLSYDGQSGPWQELHVKLRQGLIIAEDERDPSKEYWLLPGGPQSTQSTVDSPGTSQEVVGMQPSNTDDGPKKARTSVQIVVGKVLGTGGFGIVYQCTMEIKASIQQNIVIKQARDQTFETLFKENDIFNHLESHDHANIIRRVFLCRTNADTMLGLEYFEGHSLADMIVVCKSKTRAFPHSHLIAVLEQQTSAVQHLQNNGIFHCDIKPENILYNWSRESSKLIDFGLAVFRSGLSTTFKSAGGTTEYMAPETLLEGTLVVGTDIYGLGVTCWHLMTLETPWHSVPSVQEVASQSIDRKLPNYEHLRRKKRSSIKERIQNEMRRSRDAHEVYMPLQTQLMERCPEHEENIRRLVVAMMSGDPTSRPDCQAILDEMKLFNRERSLHREMSNVSLGSTNNAPSTPSEPSTPSQSNHDMTHHTPAVLNMHDSENQSSKLNTTEQETRAPSSIRQSGNNVPALDLLDMTSSQQAADAAQQHKEYEEQREVYSRGLRSDQPESSIHYNNSVNMSSANYSMTSEHRSAAVQPSDNNILQGSADQTGMTDYYENSRRSNNSSMMMSEDVDEFEPGNNYQIDPSLVDHAYFNFREPVQDDHTGGTSAWQGPTPSTLRPAGPGMYPAAPGMYTAGPGMYTAGPGMYPAGPGMYTAGPGMYPAGNTVVGKDVPDALPSLRPAGANQHHLGNVLPSEGFQLNLNEDMTDQAKTGEGSPVSPIRPNVIQSADDEEEDL